MFRQLRIDWPYIDRMKNHLALACFFALLAQTASVHAMDFGSVSSTSAILYDAPSPKANKIYVVSRYTPLELVVSLNDWIKVRNQDGSLAWIEKRALSNTRYVVVTAELADVRQMPDVSKPLVFQAHRQVALEYLESTGSGWIKVRHADGAMGYIKAAEVWGD
jgi:SH3 domain protein